MTQLMEEIGPVRIRLDFDCNETRDDVVDLLEEIAPYSGSITPQQSEEESDQEDSEKDEEEDEEEETDVESVQSKETSGCLQLLLKKLTLRHRIGWHN